MKNQYSRKIQKSVFEGLYNYLRVINTADVSISLYTKAIGINPNDAEIYYKRASFYEMRDKQDEAIADYSEAIRLNPDYTDAYLKRFQCYKRKGLKNEALSDYNNRVVRKLQFQNNFLVKIAFSQPLGEKMQDL